MREKSCRCGQSKKRFKMDIGPFYVGECCEANGFDALGNPKAGIKKPEPVTPTEVASLQKALSAPAPTNLVVEDLPKFSLPADELPASEAEDQAPEQTSALKAFFGLGGSKLKAGGRGKLRDMNLADLQKIASERGIETGTMTKKQLIEAILAKK